MTATGLAAMLGLRRSGREWRGTCPCCGYPTAFVLTDGRRGPMGWCASCRDVAAIRAALACGNLTRPTAENTAAVRDAAARRAKMREHAATLWAGSGTVVGTPAARYLASRWLPDLARSAALRYRADTPHPTGGRRPAMIAEIVNVAGDFLAIHRTYLRGDGSGKADVEPTKATLGPVWGGAVRLDAIAEELTIGEGIETSASAGRLLNLPAWAAVSAGNLAQGLVLPADVRRVTIAADHDGPGERAARQAALRWQRDGRTVRIALPDQPGRDFNDILRGGGNA
ncbi:MAG TPA: toprim domain-containing protein [Rhodocyclaceae bacterium]|nr:toprim domain-containing protein [Rhodocyclaceae bacterium]